ncbi:neprilysin-3-like [Dermacentor silvarum]|uniref:neprilysin-3-like n=1 Tax=Dermacentor silvarum TaxID=543639 RepID=UPI00189A3CDE|nr:neprilysin-3-like [Dermacentor silvarum]
MAISLAPRGRADVRGSFDPTGNASERTFDEDDPEIDKVGRSTGSVVASAEGIAFTAGLDLLFNFKAVVVVGVAIYLLTLPSRLDDPAAGRPGGDVGGCAGGDPGRCFGFRRELLGSMDLSRDPCEDFYGYVCGLWQASHPGYRDQLHYLEVRTQSLVAEKMRNVGLSARDRAKEALTMAERVSLAYLICTDTYRNKIDSSSMIKDLVLDKLLLFDQSTFHTKNLPSAVREALTTLAMKWNVPLFFQIDFSPHPRLQSKTILVLDYSLTLLHWMNHKRKILTPEATALIIAEYLNSSLAAQNSSDGRRDSALLRLDEQITLQWVSVLLSLSGRRRLRRITLKQVRRGVEEGGDEWLEAINRAGLGELRAGDEVLTSEHLFAAVDDVVNAHSATRDILRDFVALHVFRQLAPFTSYRFVDAFVSDPSRGASDGARAYVVSECISAVSRLVPGRSLINLVFHDPAVAEKRQGRALNHLSRIWNLTTKLLLGANVKLTRKRGGERLPLLNLSVVWQNGLVGAPDVKENDLTPLNVDRPFIELYLSSVAALRSRQRNESTGTLSFVRRVRERTGLLTLRNAPSRCDDAASDESVFVPTAALFEPFLALDNDPFTLGALGQFLSRGLWQLILDATREGAARGKALALADVCRRHKSRRDELDSSSSTGGDLLSTHLPSIVGLKTAHAAYRRIRENVTDHEDNDDSAEFSPAQLFYIGSCFQSCASGAQAAGRGSRTEESRVSERSLCNVPAMLSKGFGPAFGCSPGSKMMSLARRESGTCIDPDVWPPRRIAGS